MNNLTLEHKLDTIIRMLNILLLQNGIDVSKNQMNEALDCPVCLAPIKYNPSLDGKISRFCACNPGISSVNINNYGTISTENKQTSRSSTPTR